MPKPRDIDDLVADQPTPVSRRKSTRRTPVPATVMLTVKIDGELHRQLKQLALDEGATLQTLADEAFRDLLTKRAQ